MLLFFVHLEAELNLSARTIVNYRDYIALPLRTAFDHESFNFFTRSQFLKKTPVQKKLPNWCLDVALDTFSSQQFNLLQVTGQDLVLKTLFLVALASGNRAPELAVTRRKSVGVRQDKLVLPVDPTFLFKTQSFSRLSLPPISFPILETVTLFVLG